MDAGGSKDYIANPICQNQEVAWEALKKQNGQTVYTKMWVAQEQTFTEVFTRFPGEWAEILLASRDTTWQSLVTQSGVASIYIFWQMDSTK